jgi:superfamily II DNA or RNA helicase
MNAPALRPYQTEAVEAVVDGFRDWTKQLVVAPTGSGKTVMFCEVARRYPRERCLVIAHRDELLTQAQEKLAAAGLDSELEKAESRASGDAPVVVASIQTLARRRPAGGQFGFIVVGEAHHVLAESYQRVLGGFNGAKVLGVTATPDRGDKKDLGTFFENIAHEISLVELIKDGFLSRIRVKTIPLQIDISGVHSVAGDYDAGELGHALEPYLETIADKVAAEFSDRKTLAFLPLRRLSEDFVDLLRARGVPAEHVDGESSDRRDIRERFRSGETRFVSNAMLWTEGFDEPSIDCVLPLRPTRIRSLYAQQVGRGTRVFPGKDHLLILDFLWLTSRHNLVRPSALVAHDEVEAAAISGGKADGDLLEAVETYRDDVLEERKKALAAELHANRARKAAEFDLLEFSVGVKDDELLSFEPTMRWHRDAATDPQKAALERAGINPAGIQSKGQASAILDRLVKRREQGLATFKQARLLARKGHADAYSYSFGYASEVINALASRGWVGPRLNRR